MQLLPDLYNAVVEQNKSTVQSLLIEGIKEELWNYSDPEEAIHPLYNHAILPLHKAVESENIEIVQMFLDGKGDLEKKEYYIFNALEYAVSIGSQAMFLILLQYYQKHEQKMSDDGIQDLLCCASSGGNIEIIAELLRTGSKVNYLTYNHGTALMAASASGQLNVVKFLITHGAKVDFTDPKHDYPDSAVRVAILEEHWDIVEFLLPHIRNRTDKRFAERALIRKERQNN